MALQEYQRSFPKSIYTDLQDISRLTAGTVEGSPMHFRLDGTRGPLNGLPCPRPEPVEDHASHCTYLC